MKITMSIKLLLLLSINICWIQEVKSQDVIDSRINKAIDVLGIDTVLIYSFSCSGCSTSDSCKKEESHYLFWKQKGRFYIKRFDYCKDFTALELNKSNPLRFYLQYREAIVSEQIRPPTFRKITVSNNKFDTILLSSSTDHSYYHNITSEINKQIDQREVDIYDLNEYKSSDGLMNIYYKSNRRTKTYALITQIEKLIQRLNKDDLWKVEIGIY